MPPNAPSLNLLREFKHLEGRRVGSGITAAELERWMMLKQKLDTMSGSGRDRRASFRIPTHLLCSVTHESDKRRTFVSNLSVGGAFVETLAPLPAGARVELTLEAEDGESLQVQGIVVTTRLGLDLKPGEHGMGIRFTQLDRLTEQRLGSLYEHLCQRDDPEAMTGMRAATS